MIYTEEHAKQVQEGLKTQGEGVFVHRSTLGGESRASLGILICFDKKETWPNRIRHNSKYAQFIIFSNEDKLGLIAQHKGHKFRKTKINSIEELITRLQNYINQVEGGGSRAYSIAKSK